MEGSHEWRVAMGGRWPRVEGGHGCRVSITRVEGVHGWVPGWWPWVMDGRSPWVGMALGRGWPWVDGVHDVRVAMVDGGHGWMVAIGGWWPWVEGVHGLEGGHGSWDG